MLRNTKYVKRFEYKLRRKLSEIKTIKLVLEELAILQSNWNYL